MVVKDIGERKTVVTYSVKIKNAIKVEERAEREFKKNKSKALDKIIEESE